MSTALLAVRDLRVRHGRAEAVRGVQIEVHEGELVALLGSNGAGKSSLLEAISGAGSAKSASKASDSALLASEMPDITVSGAVLWNGQDLQGYPVERIFAAGLMQLKQGQGLFLRLSVRENLLLALDARGLAGAERRRVLDETMVLFRRVAQRLDLPAGSLSRVDRQVAALARAWASRPRLLMLDEPSLGLTPAEVELIFGLLARIHAGGTTLLLAEQNAHQALAIADRAYVLESGEVALSGTAAGLLQDPRMISAYLGG